MNPDPSSSPSVAFDCRCVTLESLRGAIPLAARNRTPKTVETRILKRALRDAVHTGFVWRHVAPAGEPTTYHAPRSVWVRLVKELSAEFENYLARCEATLARELHAAQDWGEELRELQRADLATWSATPAR